MTELKPCPICGGEAEINYGITYGFSYLYEPSCPFGKQIVSKCSVCGCEYMMLSSVQPYCSECGSKMDDGDSNG